MPPPLHSRWLKTLKANRDRLALIDRVGGQSWTFDELDAASQKVEPQGPVHRARADGPDFLAEVLACWREGIPLLGLEASLPTPTLPEGLDQLDPDIVHLKRTSGSTGAPRLVLFDAPALIADCEQLVSAMGLNPDLPNLAFISPAHSYGFSNLVLPLLLHGIPLILGGQPFPTTIDQALAAHGPCCVPAVPALWQVWLRSGLSEFAQIGLAISAGAPLPLEVETKAFEEYGLLIHNFFGSSECGGIAWHGDHQPRSDSRLLGHPLPAATIEISSEGLLIVRGAAVARGYLPADPALPGDGSFHTSDQIELDDKGRLLHLGRNSEALAIAGRRISPDEVESALQVSVPGTHLLVFGIPSCRSERENDVILLFGGNDLELRSTLRRAAVEALPSWLVPRRFIHCPTLAPDIRGKISRTQWRKWMLKQKS